MNYRLLLLLAGLSLLTSCGTDPEDVDISGITRTFETGQVTEIDPDDWRMEVRSGTTEPWAALSPAYPNPVMTGQEEIAFHLQLQTIADVTCDVVDKKGERVRRIFVGRLTAGELVMIWDLLNDDEQAAPPGLYRIVFTLIDAGNENNRLSSYGDIEIVRK